MIKKIDKPSEVLEFAWELSQNDLFASYPRFESYARLEKELKNAVKLDNHSAIAYFHEGVLWGLCFYFWINAEKYVQTVGFLIRGDYGRIADEFLTHIRGELPGYELLIGMPSANTDAHKYFRERNIPSVEESIVTRICNLTDHTYQKENCIEKISWRNFQSYAVFHDVHSIPAEMYYTSGNLLTEIDRFGIFAYRDKGVIQGSIFAKVGKELADIVGLFMNEEYKNRGIEKNLINELLAQLYDEFGPIKEILFFIDEGSAYDLEVALSAGFKIKERYRLYRYSLQ